MKRSLLSFVVVALAACKPTCKAGDLECLAKTLRVSDITADVSGEGTRLELFAMDTVRLGEVQQRSTSAGGTNASAGLSLEANTTLDFETSVDFGVLFFIFQDSQGCRPALCFTPCPKGVRCLTGSSCTPSVRDGLRSGTGFHRVEYGSQPATELSFELLITPVSAPDCPANVTQALTDGTARVGLSSLAKVNIPGADGTGLPSGTGGGGGGTGGGSGGSCSITFTQCCSTSNTSLCGVDPATCDACPAGTRQGIICAAGSPCNTSGGISAGSRLCHCQ